MARGDEDEDDRIDRDDLEELRAKWRTYEELEKRLDANPKGVSQERYRLNHCEKCEKTRKFRWVIIKSPRKKRWLPKYRHAFQCQTCHWEKQVIGIIDLKTEMGLGELKAPKRNRRNEER